MSGLYAEILQRVSKFAVFLKEGGGAKLQAVSGETLKDNVFPHST